MQLAPENIKYLIIHSSHTPRPKPDDGVDLLNRQHRLRGAFSWELDGVACIHHYVIRADGGVESGRPLDVPGNHTYGFNECSISICYMGGVNAQGKWTDTRTPKQKRALRDVVAALSSQFPGAAIVTHEQLAPKRAKGCPGFSIHEL